MRGTVDTSLTPEEARARVMFYGTEEAAYTDSGLWDFLQYIKTKDSHDKENPVKFLLEDDPVYAIIVFLFMLAFDDLALPKSRQIRMSWFATTFACWMARTAPYREIIYQTKKEADAFAMVSEGSKNPSGGRMDFIEQHLPSFLKDPNITSGKGNMLGQLIYSEEHPSDDVTVPWHGSKIHAIPQGAHQVRQYTISLGIFDEAAYQEEYGKARVAAAAAAAGGKMIALSSVNAGSAFNQMVLEAPDGQEPVHHVPEIIQKALGLLGLQWPKGMRAWRTPSGVQVLETHYTSDPAKDPGRGGAEWVKKAARRYVGGMDSSGWKTEMDIDYNAGGGDPVFPFITSRSHPIFAPEIDKKEAISRFNFVAGYDHGMDSPSAFEVWGIDYRGYLYALWELYEPCMNATEFVEKMKKCPYWSRLQDIYCDPKIMGTKDQMSADGNKTIGEQFFELGVNMRPGRRGQDVPMAMKFSSTYWEDPLAPKAFITDGCPNLQREVMGLKWQKHVSEIVAQRKNNPNKIVDKDNHAWDATCYVLDTQPRLFEVKAGERPEGIYMDDLIKQAEENYAERKRPSYGIQVNI